MGLKATSYLWIHIFFYCIKLQNDGMLQRYSTPYAVEPYFICAQRQI